MLTSPAYLLLAKDEVLVTEYSRGEILGQKNDGYTGLKYSIPGSNLLGMLIDGGENIYVCDENKSCVCVITDGGTKHNTFLELPDRNAKPTSISFRTIDSTLIVTGYKKIYVYKVKPK